MNFKLQTNVKLSALTTIKIGGVAKYFTIVDQPAQLPEIFKWLKEHSLPYFILSGGSNIVFDDGVYDGLVIKIDIRGFEVIKKTSSLTWLRVGAGENWDKTVQNAVQLGLSGIEALSGIPGNCGAAPVQNIGAYGQEIKDVIEKVETFDTQTLSSVELTNDQCGFSYRDSNFKSAYKGRYIITAIVMKLSNEEPGIPHYPDVIQYFEKKNLSQPTLGQIRQAIIDIRTNKLPDPAKIPNVGSFFKAVFVSDNEAEKLKQKFPEIKMIQINSSVFKLHPGWLIEHSGLDYKRYEKPYKHKHVQIDKDHALVLENTGGASQKELMELVSDIQKVVKTKFQIELEPEPEIVKFD